MTIGDDSASEGADPAPGLFGGEPAGLNELRLVLPDGTVREWGSKEIVHGIPPGTVCIARNGGGGGYGDPRRRDPRKVLAEVRDGLLSVEKARVELRRRRPRRRAGDRRGRDGAAPERRRVSYRIGIDVGGTFTDFLLIGPDDLRLVHKTSSTPDDPSVGFVTGLGEIAALLELDLPALLARTEVMVHGTTVTTNAVLTRRGAATGLLATKGFRDALALRNGAARVAVRQPAAAAGATRSALPARRRRGAHATTRATRSCRSPRTTSAPPASSFAAEGVEAVAISFMHSPAGPAHERRARDLCRELLPGAYVTASSDLLPQVRYYDRTSTTVLNAYVGPIITRYLGALTGRLAELDFGGVLLIMQSNGGVATPAEVVRARLALAPLRAGVRARGGAVAARPARARRLHHDRHGGHELRRGPREGRRAARDDRRRSSTAGGSRCR